MEHENSVKYNGKDNMNEIKSLFMSINNIVKEHNLPTNLYIHSISALDIGIINFYSFDLELSINNDGVLITSVRDKHQNILNHVILKPNATLTFKHKIVLDFNNQEFLAISLYVNL